MIILRITDEVQNPLLFCGHTPMVIAVVRLGSGH